MKSQSDEEKSVTPEPEPKNPPAISGKRGMKVQFNREGLSQALALLTTIVPDRTPKPILRCVKIDAAKDGVRIYGTDMEVGINYLLPAVEVKEPGQVVVPAARLAAVVRESTDETLMLKATEGLCEVRGADSHFSIYGQEPSQYPPVPVFKGEPIEIGFNPQFLAEAIRVIREPQFELELGQSDTPGLIKAGANFLHVLMPINLCEL